MEKVGNVPLLEPYSFLAEQVVAVSRSTPLLADISHASQLSELWH